MKTKKLNNSKTMRTGLIVAVIAIISLIAIVMTFAKYASQGTGEDSVRIAKWGVNASVPIDLDLFDPSYIGTGGKTTVDSSDEVNVIAPGTSRLQAINLAFFTGDQAPEVMYHFEPTLTIANQSTTSTQTISLLEKLNQNKAFTWRLVDANGTEQSYQTYQELQSAVSNMGEKDIAPNHFPANFGGSATPQIKIGWNWDYEYSGTTNDPLDTQMGDLAVADILTGLNTTLTLNAYQCQGCSSTSKTILSGQAKGQPGGQTTEMAVANDVKVIDDASVIFTSIFTSQDNANTVVSTVTADGGYYSMNVPINTTGILTLTKSGYKTQETPITTTTEAKKQDFPDVEFVGYNVKLDKVNTSFSPDISLVEHSVSYNVSDDNSMSIINLDDTSQTIIPTTEIGYNFDGWYLGETKITGEGDLSSDVTFTAKSVEQQTIDASANPAKGLVYNGGSQNLGNITTVPSDAKKEYSLDGGATYSENEPAAINAATYTVYYKASKAGYKTIEGTFNATIATKDAIVTADHNSKTYGDTDPELTATVTGLLGEDTVSYTLARTGGENVGLYEITASGAPTQGNYTVSYVPGGFTIEAKSIGDCTIEDIADSTYTGQEIKPEVTVKDGTTTLEKDTDYTVSYSDNVNAGTAKATVTGKGNYGESVDKEFTINKATNPMNFPDQSDTSSVFSSDQSVAYTFNAATGTPEELSVTYSVTSSASSQNNFYIPDSSNNVLVCAENTGVDTYTINLTATSSNANYEEKEITKSFTWTVEKQKKAIQTTIDSQTVNFLPAVSDGDWSKAGLIFYKSDDKGKTFIELSEATGIEITSMSTLATAIKSAGADKVYADTTGATFYGTIYRSWDNTFYQAKKQTGYPESLDSAFATAIHAKNIKTMYGDYCDEDTKEWKWDNKKAEGNCNASDTSKGPNLNGVDYNSFYKAYSSLLSSNAHHPWSSRAYGFYHAYCWIVNDNRWNNAYTRPLSQAVVLSQAY